MGDINILITCTKKCETPLSVLRTEKIVESIIKNGTHKGEKNIRKYNVVIYIISLLAIIFSKYAVKPFVPMLDFAGYGAMRPFFESLLTCILWVIEIVVMCNVFKKKLNISIISNKETKGQELPVKRIFIIAAVMVACIVVISAQIGFQVKPFYDLGEKFNGYELTNNAGVFLRNIVKCVWIVIMIKAAQEFVEDIRGKGRSINIYAGIVLMLTLGVYDLIAGNNNLDITYFVLNVVYGWIYLLTDRSMLKSYLLIMFIYLF